MATGEGPARVTSEAQDTLFAAIRVLGEQGQPEPLHVVTPFWLAPVAPSAR